MTKRGITEDKLRELLEGKKWVWAKELAKAIISAQESKNL